MLKRDILRFLKQESETIQLGRTELDIPIIACWIIDEVHCAFWCRFCKRLHLHGIGDGYRASHCSEPSPYDKDYYLIIQGDLTKEKKEDFIKAGYNSQEIEQIQDLVQEVPDEEISD